MPDKDTKVTTDHDTIRKWAEDRGGKPAVAHLTFHNDPGPDHAPIRILFPDTPGSDQLDEVSWPQLFRVFEEKNLAFAYQDQTSDGKTSHYFDFVQRPGSKRSPGEARGSSGT
jgi:hypothetical protein